MQAIQSFQKFVAGGSGSTATPDQASNHGFGPDAENGSGWSNPDVANVEQYAKPSLATAGQAAVVTDGNQVNQAQVERVRELAIPLPDDGPDTDEEWRRVQPAATAPDEPVLMPTPTSEQMAVARLASSYRPNYHAPDEALDMGLFRSDTEARFHDTLTKLKRRDAAMFAAPHRKKSRRYYDGSDPPPRMEPIGLSQQLPGSAAATYLARSENPITNDLEQILVTNPEARRNLLDKGTFCTHYRAINQYPAAMRQFLEPKSI